jgi:hypothetical protein
VIRRLFWMTIGAVAGVTGYRRLSQLAQAMNPSARRRARRGDRGRYSGIAEFLGDVRDGMELYVNRRPGSGGPAVEGQHVLGEGTGQTAASRGHPGTDYAKDGR